MDVMPMQYEMAIQFAFDEEQGRKFNQGKNNIMKSLGFNRAERMDVKRMKDGHSDECHAAETWIKGKNRVCKLNFQVIFKICEN